MQIKKLFIALSIVLPLHMQGQNFLIKDAPEVIESYVNQFNREDNELYKQDIPNCGASDFLRKNIPFFFVLPFSLFLSLFRFKILFLSYAFFPPTAMFLSKICEFYLFPHSELPPGLSPLHSNKMMVQ